MDANRKSRVIYSIHIDIPEEKLDTDLGAYKWDDIPRALRTKLQYLKYHDNLLENQKEYAEKIGVDYIHYGRDEEYENFYQKWKDKYPYLTEYLIINFYKLYLCEKLSHEYDEVLYIDFDVIFMTDENYFDAHDTEKGIYLYSDNKEEDAMHHLVTSMTRLDLRSEINKWFIGYAMFMDEYETFDGDITNTGIILGSSKWIQQLGFMDLLEHMIELVTKLREDPDSMYPDYIQETLDWNNEPFYAYAAQKNSVPLINNRGEWNYIVNFSTEEEDFHRAEKKVVHMILKRFDWIWE